MPTHTFASLPASRLDLHTRRKRRCGGIINDRETIEFVREQAGAAKYVTSVCTGAFVLGVAGSARRGDGPRPIGPILIFCPSSELHEKARVVKDGNVITGGGVTAGIDFGLSVIAEIAGETTARSFSSA